MKNQGTNLCDAMQESKDRSLMDLRYHVQEVGLSHGTYGPSYYRISQQLKCKEVDYNAMWSVVMYKM